MSTAAPLQNLAAKSQPLSNSTHGGLLLQRKCACGSPTASLTGECAECKSKKRLQTKLDIGGSNDPALRQDMEQRFAHDFSRVRVHSGGAPEQASADQTEARRAPLQPTTMPGLIAPTASSLQLQQTLGNRSVVRPSRAAHFEPASQNGLPRCVQDVIGSPGQPLDSVIGAAVAPYLESLSGRARLSHTSAAREDGHEREADRVAKAAEGAPASAGSSHHEDSAMLRTVRIHTDARAAESAREVAARAYTVGDHIAFAAGRFQPHTPAGRSLLAHELTHVVQWRSAGSQFVDVAPPLLRSPDPVLEAENARTQARWELREGWHSDISATSEESYDQYEKRQRMLAGRLYPWLAPKGAVLFANLEMGFATGFMTALSEWVDPLDFVEFKRSMREHPIKFGAGYLAGIITGVGRDLVWNLVGLVDLAKLALLLTPAGMTYLGYKESQKWAEDPGARAALYKSVISALLEFQKYIETDPTALLPQGRELGFMAGDALGEYARHMVLDEKDPYNKGVAVGYPVGIIALEIALLFISWEKYALRGVTAAGKGMQRAGRRAAPLLTKTAFGKKVEAIVKTGEALVEKTGSAAEKALDAERAAKVVTKGDEPAAVAAKVEQPAAAATKVDQPAAAAAKVDKPAPSVANAKPTYQSTDEVFASLKQELKDVPEATGPVTGQKLGAAPPGQVPVRAKRASRQLEAKMAADKKKAVLDDMKRRAPGVHKDVVKPDVPLQSGQRLEDYAVNNPERVEAFHADWVDGITKGNIKKETTFAAYVKRRVSGDRGLAGELEDAFVRGSDEILVKAPKSKSNLRGTDSMSYQIRKDRIKYLDNKSVTTDAMVGKVSAVEKNLLQNMADDIADLERAIRLPDVPPEIEHIVLPRLKAALAELKEYTKMKRLRPEDLYTPEVRDAFDSILRNNGIDRVVTFGGAGQGAHVSKPLSDVAGFKTERP